MARPDGDSVALARTDPSFELSDVSIMIGAETVVGAGSSSKRDSGASSNTGGILRSSWLILDLADDLTHFYNNLNECFGIISVNSLQNVAPFGVFLVYGTRFPEGRSRMEVEAIAGLTTSDVDGMHTGNVYSAVTSRVSSGGSGVEAISDEAWSTIQSRLESSRSKTAMFKSDEQLLNSSLRSQWAEEKLIGFPESKTAWTATHTHLHSRTRLGKLNPQARGSSDHPTR